MTRSTKL